jgi:hypothetical protein
MEQSIMKEKIEYDDPFTDPTINNLIPNLEATPEPVIDDNDLIPGNLESQEADLIARINADAEDFDSSEIERLPRITPAIIEALNRWFARNPGK